MWPSKDDIECLLSPVVQRRRHSSTEKGCGGGSYSDICQLTAIKTICSWYVNIERKLQLGLGKTL